MLQLTPDEARVLGVLIEKAMTTPEQYPLSQNAVVNGAIYVANQGGSVTLTASPSESGATGMSYSWNYIGGDDGGNLSSGTVGEAVFGFTNNAPWALIAGSRKEGTLYLSAKHNQETVLSASWPVYIVWD